jgi:hypothetical protein
MARNIGSTFDTISAAREATSCGRHQLGTCGGQEPDVDSWDSWQRPYVSDQPMVWQHDVFHVDGTPYRAREVELLKSLTSGEETR